VAPKAVSRAAPRAAWSEVETVAAIVALRAVLTEEKTKGEKVAPKVASRAAPRAA